MIVLTAEEMQNVDKCTIEKIGIPQEVLMERAALAVADKVCEKNPKHVLCVCGKGNNGGDGIAVARILKERGICATVYLCVDINSCKPAIVKQADIFKAIGGNIISEPDFTSCDLIVDAVFGVGLSKEVQGHYKEILHKMNEEKEAGKTIVSVDIPSGIDTDTGAVLGVAVKADETVTFAYAKRGHFLYPGKEYTGKLTIAEAGMDVSYAYDKHYPFSFTYEDAECKFPVRSKDGNKGTFGRILVIAGSESMNGACYLSALAAFRCGCGLVDIFTAKTNLDALKTMLPEAILNGYEGKKEDIDNLLALLKKASCVILGPGLSKSEFAAELVRTVLKNYDKTIVLDADALNIVAENPNLIYNHNRFAVSKMIFTPHPGELSRLTGKSVPELKNNYISVLKEYALKNHVVIVGKGASSIVTDGEHVFINTTGNDGMATAGSGDVLTGFIASFAVMENEFISACKGVYFHGKAGDVSYKERGAGLLAHEIADSVAKL